ncbi:MAG: hypothetical protein KF903_08980 [Dokdonella sp.]|uniref:hypothetical protein n=1 Tax=Dokdonella sp. TaxID=2291710 RepID=UPI0025B9D57D|nr:hypothetical protein [Dokdonella sp.]MBX3701114.1 hypothetical protein [Dokdonella sp.]
MPDLHDSMPWYVNRTLDGPMCAELARRLRNDPALRNELAFWEQVATGQSRLDAVAEDIALQRTLERIRRETGTHVARRDAPASRQAPVRSLLGRLLALPEGWLRPALACTLLVVVAQSVALLVTRTDGHNLMRGSATHDETAGAHIPADSVLLRVAFDPAVSEAQMRLLLARYQASIVAGPGEGGDYYLAVPSQRAIAATDGLRAAPAVRSVVGVERLPAPRPPKTP